MTAALTSKMYRHGGRYDLGIKGLVKGKDTETMVIIARLLHAQRWKGGFHGH